MKKETFPLVIPNEILDWVRKEASKANRSISNFITTVLINKKENEETTKQ